MPAQKIAQALNKAFLKVNPNHSQIGDSCDMFYLFPEKEIRIVEESVE